MSSFREMPEGWQAHARAQSDAPAPGDQPAAEDAETLPEQQQQQQQQQLARVFEAPPQVAEAPPQIAEAPPQVAPVAPAAAPLDELSRRRATRQAALAAARAWHDDTPPPISAA